MIQQTKINDKKRYNIKNDKLNDTTPQKTTLQFCKVVSDCRQTSLQSFFVRRYM